MAQSKTSLLLHFNGSDGATAFVDNSAGRHAVTPHGNAHISAERSKFGGFSGKFDGTGDYLTLDGSPDFVFDHGDFTIDCWICLSQLGEAHFIYDGRNDFGGVTPFLLVGDQNRLQFIVDNAVRIDGVTQLFANILYHVALVRLGAETTLYLNGTREGSFADDNVYIAALATSPVIGKGLIGFIDELRVLQGEAAFSGPFELPTGQYGDPVLPSMPGWGHAPRYYAGDRHVRRDGAAYSHALSSLLPTGIAWPRDVSSVLMKVVSGLSEIWGAWVDRRAADLLEIEADPRLTLEMLSDWERAWGLPDDCFFGIGQTLSERRKFLVLKMTLKGGQSREWFIWVSAQLGYSVTISEFAPFMCGVSHLGDTRVFDPSVNQFVGDFLG